MNPHYIIELEHNGQWYAERDIYRSLDSAQKSAVWYRQTDQCGVRIVRMTPQVIETFTAKESDNAR